MPTAREHARGIAKLRETYDRMIDGWLRPGRNGWLLTDNQGRVYPLSTSDGERLRVKARTKIDELFLELEGSVWYMMIPAVAVAMLGLLMLDQLAFYGAMPAAVYFVPCLMFLFKDVITEIRFALAMSRWREELAAKARAACGKSHETGDYSIWNDERLGAWMGWALFGPGLPLMLIPIDPLVTMLGIGLTFLGVYQLRAHYGVTG
jgi:hypothetical protein